MDTTLTRRDWEEFLVRVFFGWGYDYLTLALERAYRDLNRTLHGIATHGSRNELHADAIAALHAAFGAIGSGQMILADQAEFDDWHAVQCANLSRIARSHDYPRLYVGQAQKWINMTFKYVATLGESRLPGFGGVYKWCHVPLDNVVLTNAAGYGFAGLGIAWSRVDDYEQYLACQQWFRETFTLAPLDVEYRLWQGETVPTRSTNRSG